jgi:hypothetical protein
MDPLFQEVLHAVEAVGHSRGYEVRGIEVNESRIFGEIRIAVTLKSEAVEKEYDRTHGLGR